jgi:hypothetical protein
MGGMSQYSLSSALCEGLCTKEMLEVRKCLLEMTVHYGIEVPLIHLSR